MAGKSFLAACAAAALTMGMIFTPGIAIAAETPAPQTTDAPAPAESSTPAEKPAAEEPAAEKPDAEKPDAEPSTEKPTEPAPEPSPLQTSGRFFALQGSFAPSLVANPITSYTVPAGVTAISITAWGAQGGGGTQNAPGGLGGGISSTITVTPGQVLQVNTGSAGGGAGLGGTGIWATSGAGGGASDVRVGACAATLTCDLADRVVVAGGGGGAGGQAGPAGYSIQICGGNAGAQPDGSGNTGCRREASSDFPDGGGGGTLTAGGGGGANHPGYPANAGYAGTLGYGASAPPANSSAGGGGGDGYYGGGSGSSSTGGSQNINGGGGGGGSNWATAAALSTRQLSPGRSGDGVVTITPLTATTSTSTTLTLTTPTALVSSQVTFTVATSPAAPSGTVNFASNLVTVPGCDAVPVVGGTASCTTSYSSIGARSIRAIFSGTSALLPSTSTILTQTINPTPTASVLSTSANPITAAAPVTYTSTVSPTPTSGTVAFSDNGSGISSCLAVAVNTSTGTASCTIIYPASGSHTIGAVYSGVTDFLTSTAPTLAQTVIGTATTSVLASDSNPSGLGAGVTYRVTVTPVPTSGTVAFTESGTNITGCATSPVNTTTGVAICDVSYPTTGSHSIGASFSGSADYAPSVSGTVTQVVNSGAAQLGPSNHYYTVPAGVTAISITAWGAQGGGGSQNVPGGTGGGITSVINVTPGQVLQVMTGSRGGGAGLGGSGIWGVSGGGGGASDVRVGTCAATLSCGLTDRVVVGGGGGGAGGPAGIVGQYSIQICGGNAGAQPDGSGNTGCRREASADFPDGGGGGTLTAGGGGGANHPGYPANAGYAGTLGYGASAPPANSTAGGGGGDGYYGGGSGSSSAGGGGNINGGGGGGGSNWAATANLSTRQLGTGRTGDGLVTITPLTSLTATSTALVVAPTTQESSGSVTFTATISPATSSGTVNFSTDGAVLPECDTVAVVGGIATCTTAFQPIGVRVIRAVFSGNATLKPSTSAAINQTTVLATTATAVTSSLASVAAAAPITYTATVTPKPTSGTMSFLRGGIAIAACTNVGMNIGAGTATCTESYVTSGDRSITAVYSGDVNYKTSTAPAFIQHVTGTPTTVAIVSPQPTSAVGKSVTFTATVSPVPNGGTMSFSSDSAVISACSAQTVSTVTGTATCRVPYTTIGSRSLTATFSGVADYDTSTSAAITQSVVKSAVTFTPGVDTFTVPAGWSQITVTAWGAQGGGGSQNAPGGTGGGVTSVINVTPGQVIQVMTGRQGGGAGLGGSGIWGVSGGGGGASDIRIGTCAATASCALTDRVLVGGGGGGAAGQAGPAGYSIQICGGNAGAQPDGSGNTGCRREASADFPDGGGGGTLTAGGGGGANHPGYPANAGYAGTLGYGASAPPANSTAGGGGGDGYYGGGSGSSATGSSSNINGGGGGGGSNWISSTLTTSSLLGTGRTGDGVVTITHTATQLALTGASTDLAFGATRVLTASILDSGGNVVDSGPASTSAVSFASTGTATFSGLTTVTAVAGVAILTVTATGVGSGSFTASGATFTATPLAVTVVKAAQTITFTDPGGPFVYGTSFTVAPTASSGGAVTITALGSCSASGTTITMISGTGNCTVRASQAGTANYSAATDVDRVVSAAKATQATLTNSGPATGTYGENYVFTGGAGSGTGAISFAVSGTACSYVSGVGDTGTIKVTAGTGTCVVTATRAADGNYLARSADAGLSPAKRSLAVNAVASSKIYGAVDPVFTSTLSGFATGDTATNSSITGAASCARTANELVLGSSAIQCSPATLAAPNYVFAAGATAAFAVTAAPLAVTASSATIAYGDATPAITPAYDGFVNGDQAPLTPPTCTTAVGPATSVGSYSSACTGGADPNYIFSYVSGSVAVIKATQVITFLQPLSPAVYGSSFAVSPTSTSALQVSVAASGGCSVAASGVSWNVTMTSGTADCALTATQAGDSNREPAVSVARTVSPNKAAQAAIVISGAASVGYADTSTYTASGGSGSGAFAFALNSGSVCVVDSSTATTITVEFTAGTGSCGVIATKATDANYLVASATSTFAATKQPLTVDGIAQAKIYGELDPAFGYELHGFVNGDGPLDVAGTATCTRVTGEPVGDYAVTCAPGTLSSDDYSFATGSAGTLSIGAAALTITASDASSHYGDPAPAITASYSGLANGDLAPATVPSCLTTAGQTSVTGTYPSTCSGAVDANYTIAYLPGVVTVLKAAQAAFTVTSAATGVYGTFVTAATSGGSGTGAVTVTASGACVTGTQIRLTAAGTCTITAVKAGDTNYTVIDANTTVAVTPAILVVDASPATKVQGAADPAIDWTVRGLIVGDSDALVTGQPECTRAAGEQPGAYEISCAAGTLAAPNYSVTTGSASTLTITARPVVPAASAGDPAPGEARGNATGGTDSGGTGSGTGSDGGTGSGDAPGGGLPPLLLPIGLGVIVIALGGGGFLLIRRRGIL